MLIEGNVVDDAKWDAVGAMNTTKTAGQPPVPVGPNPVVGVDIVDNQVTVTVTVTVGASGARRDAVRVTADTAGFVSPVSDVAVTGNTVSGGGFSYSANVTFRPGTTPQR